MPCDKCRAMKALKNKEPDCANCKPKLLEENYPIISLMERYGSLFVDGMGGISAEGIKLALDSEFWIEEVDRSSYTRKLVVYLTTAIETQKKETTLDGKENPSRSTSKR